MRARKVMFSTPSSILKVQSFVLNQLTRSLKLLGATSLVLLLRFSCFFTKESKMSYLEESQELSRQSGTIEVGLSWELVAGSIPVDLDASAVCFNSTGTLVDAVFYNQLSALNGAITHSGDCKKGEKEGFDEVVKISLDDVKGVNVIVFTINAFSGGSLEHCESALCEIKIDGTVLATMSANRAQTGSSTALLVCALFRHPHTLNWHYTTIRQATTGRHFSACLLPIRAVVDQLIDPGSVGERALNTDKTFEMNKGDQVSIPTHMHTVLVDLNWTTVGEGMDIDTSCVMLAPRANGKLYPVDVCSFVHQERPGVRHLGDNVTGGEAHKGYGYDERMIIKFEEVDSQVTALAVVITVFSADRTFAELENASVSIKTSSVHPQPLATFPLTGKLSKNALLFCMFVRGRSRKDPWTLVTLGEECEGNSIFHVRSVQWEGEARIIKTEPPSDGCCAVC